MWGSPSVPKLLPVATSVTGSTTCGSLHNKQGNEDLHSPAYKRVSQHSLEQMNPAGPPSKVKPGTTSNANTTATVISTSKYTRPQPNCIPMLALCPYGLFESSIGDTTITYEQAISSQFQ
eukprot:Filipodium_phascolosomae@DN2460_c0_g1_i6.p1